MKVKDIMIRNVISVSPETKITEVSRILFENKFHALPVVENKKVVGIVAENDFFTRDCENIFLPSHINFIKKTEFAYRLEGEEREKLEKLINVETKDIMAKECVSILEDMDVTDLLEFFKETKFVTLPVVDNEDKLVGIITVSDILGLISQLKS